jgi:hypothetical protein
VGDVPAQDQPQVKQVRRVHWTRRVLARACANSACPAPDYGRWRVGRTAAVGFTKFVSEPFIVVIHSCLSVQPSCDRLNVYAGESQQAGLPGGIDMSQGEYLPTAGAGVPGPPATADEATFPTY